MKTVRLDLEKKRYLLNILLYYYQIVLEHFGCISHLVFYSPDERYYSHCVGEELAPSESLVCVWIPAIIKPCSLEILQVHLKYMYLLIWLHWVYLWHAGPSIFPWHVGFSSWIQDRTQSPCIGSLDSKPLTTREVPSSHLPYYMPKMKQLGNRSQLYQAVQQRFEDGFGRQSYASFLKCLHLCFCSPNTSSLPRSISSWLHLLLWETCRI